MLQVATAGLVVWAVDAAAAARPGYTDIGAASANQGANANPPPQCPNALAKLPLSLFKVQNKDTTLRLFCSAMEQFTPSLYETYEHNKWHFLEEYQIVFPTQDNDIANFPRDEVEQHFESARINVHSDVLQAMQAFLDDKRHTGSRPEQALYADMTLPDFVTRLFRQRPLAFYYKYDTHVTKERGFVKSGVDIWPNIGTNYEQAPYLLRDYLSYPEIMFSALCGLSSWTHYVNDCARPARREWPTKYAEAGKLDMTGAYQPSGVVHGLVGPRMAHGPRMDAIAILADKYEQGDVHDVPAQLMQTIYAGEFGEQVKVDIKDKEGGKVGEETFYLNLDGLKKRTAISCQLFVFDAIYRAKQAQMNANPGDAPKKAFLHVVGLGTGEWAVDGTKVQATESIINETKAAVEATANAAEYISGVSFAFMGSEYESGSVNGVAYEVVPHGNNDPKPRNTASPLANPNDILVSMYAWDGNSFPGNEWYLAAYFKAHPNEAARKLKDELDRRMGLWLFGSGDSATASCSTIPYVHNAVINSKNIQGRLANVYCADGKQIVLEDLLTPNGFTLDRTKMAEFCPGPSAGSDRLLFTSR